jgi:hypothetical protein
MWGNSGMNSTMRNLPYVREYSKALGILNNTPPIKGSGTNGGMIPLGARNNVTAYSVRAGTVDATDVEFVLYKTPVITFKADGRILVFMEKWNTNTTREFINTILRVSCYAKSGKSVMELTGGEKAVIPPTGLVLRYDTEATPPRLVFDDKPKFTGYAVSRAKANKVRAQFSQFAKYFKGCVNLRSVEMAVTSYYNPFNRFNTEPVRTYQAIEFTFDEISQTMSVSPDTDIFRVATSTFSSSWSLLLHRPFHQFRPQGYDTYANWIAQYNAKCAEFFDLIKNDQPEDTKTENFYKAFVVIMALHLHNHSTTNPPNNVMSVQTDTVVENFEKTWKMYFARDILEEVVLKDGTTPNQTYINWMWMYDQVKVAESEAQERRYKGEPA